MELVKFDDTDKQEFLFDYLESDYPDALEHIKQKFIEKHETEILERL